MPRPICFMIMPFGVKPTLAFSSGEAPDSVDFDRLWEAALRPAIESAGYVPVRASEDIGALIITEMIERLAISDLVLADVSILNGNVYYEVGIRHAAQRQGCIMTAATWAKPLFDMNQMRQIRYPLPVQSISDEQAETIAGLLRDAIETMRTSDSPFYQVFPQYPDYDAKRATSFRQSLVELSQFQAELRSVRAAQREECQTQALSLRDKYYTGGPVQKAVALELLFTLRDCTDWATTEKFISTLPGDLRNSPLVQEQRALAKSKSGDHNTAIGALQELIETSGDTSERRGLLGGRYKKKWMEGGDPRDLDCAIQEYERGMGLDLNDYYPSSNLARLYRKRNRRGDAEKALRSASVTLLACERARQRKSTDEWLNATLLGAAFDLGDVEKVEELAYAAKLEGAAKWKLDTTLADCRVSASLLEEPRRGELLALADQLATALH